METVGQPANIVDFCRYVELERERELELKDF